eukprot:CAMPEP_0204410740 /NCGR_PEP_ID=MMETSP0470-20130426/10926_1 /ASSEMBLY_ACC=CAM_ASM_000385 /TAXON_ID=2969 /ORGANISM="Oxyrrhis marina" /LENGTH=154 /DNA_ID=CAMNT_0051406659 /DNA_START=15 /DNA_END=479 /DNA_ORIENTATION=+
MTLATLILCRREHVVLGEDASPGGGYLPDAGASRRPELRAPRPHDKNLALAARHPLDLVHVDPPVHHSPAQLQLHCLLQLPLLGRPSQMLQHQATTGELLRIAEADIQRHFGVVDVGDKPLANNGSILAAFGLVAIADDVAVPVIQGSTTRLSE